MTEVTNPAGVQERLAEALRAYRHLVLFFPEPRTPVIRAMGALLEAFSADRLVDAEAALAAYRQFFGILAEDCELRRHTWECDAWRNHLIEALLADENVFSRKALLVDPSEMGPALLSAARHDLRRVQVLFRLESSLFETALSRRIRWATADGSAGAFVPWEDLRPLGGAAQASDEREFVEALLSAKDWGSMVEDLARHYWRSGTGIFHRYRAFRWVPGEDGGRLEGVAEPDPVTLEELIGYDEERRLLLRNTEHFVSGRPANNVLLYGDRGTGKSCTVKALLNAFSERGLRLVEVGKQHLADFPRIIALLRERRERFILFVDDLSFEENEAHYKELKAVLEGGLDVRPDNVVLYATSNRRHLLPERFSERDLSDSEIHSRDASQEKLSLSDRFGITATFLAPDQEGYLRIVLGLAQRYGLRWPEEVLRTRALQWAARHNGWSGRTARQFLTFALAEQAAGDTGAP